MSPLRYAADPDICSQCGKRFEDMACGISHALIQMVRTHRADVDDVRRDTRRNTLEEVRAKMDEIRNSVAFMEWHRLVNWLDQQLADISKKV